MDETKKTHLSMRLFFMQKKVALLSLNATLTQIQTE
jgi:hypothetical protein